MSLIYVNGTNGDLLDRSHHEDETDSALGSSHSNSTHSPDITAERYGLSLILELFQGVFLNVIFFLNFSNRDVVVNGEERYEDYGVAGEQEPEAFNPFGDMKKSLRYSMMVQCNRNVSLKTILCLFLLKNFILIDSTQLNGLAGNFNRTASVRRSFRRPSPAYVPQHIRISWRSLCRFSSFLFSLMYSLVFCIRKLTKIQIAKCKNMKKFQKIISKLWK